MATVSARILRLGKYVFPSDKNKPYWVELEVGPKNTVIQTMPEKLFFDFINALIMPREEKCGMIHVPTVSVEVQGPAHDAG